MTSQEYARPKSVHVDELDGTERSGSRDDEVGFPEFRFQTTRTILSQYYANVRILDRQTNNFFQSLELRFSDPRSASNCEEYVDFQFA